VAAVEKLSSCPSDLPYTALPYNKLLPIDFVSTKNIQMEEIT
jgi:hypothetical protein